jgi:DNA adenine methylase
MSFLLNNKKIELNNMDNDNSIVCNIEEMDLTKLKRLELLAKCEELGITKCKSKNKGELIDLINKTQVEIIIEDIEDIKDNKDIDNEEKIDIIETTLNALLKNDYNNEIISTSNSVGTYEKYEPYLSNFLKTIRNKNGTYKRICISPLRYAGGKSKAIGLILENLPKLKEKKIVSPFFGGGSVELCLSQMLGINVIGYDIFNMLVNFWNVLINYKSEFITELMKFDINEEEFTYNRHVLLNYWEKIKPTDLNYKTKNKITLKPEDLTKLDENNILQAVYYYYNMTLSYGPMFLGWPSSNEINKDKFKRRIDKIKEMNLVNLQVNCASYQDVLNNHINDFLFLDPPYYLEGDSKMFKGMYPNCNFAIHHNGFDHIKLAEMLKNHKGGFLMTYNNCSKIRDLYNDCKFEYPEWQYTYGQGETRIGKNRQKSTKDNIKESHEIIIIKWPEYY